MPAGVILCWTLAAWTVPDGTCVPNFKTEAHHRDRSAQWGHKGRKCEVFLTLLLLTPHPNMSASPPGSLPTCQLGTGCSSELRATRPPILRETGEAGTSVPRRKACRCKAPSSQEQRSARNGFLFCFGLSHSLALPCQSGSHAPESRQPWKHRHPLCLAGHSRLTWGISSTVAPAATVRGSGMSLHRRMWTEGASGVYTTACGTCEVRTG